MDPEIHPDNKGFTWSVPNGPYQYLSNEQVEQFDKKGYLSLEDAFDLDLMNEVVNLIDPFEAKVTQTLKGLEGDKFFISRAEEITFTTHLVTQSEELKKFSKNEVFCGLCLDLVGDDVRLYWDQAVYKKPGTRDEFPWHQDNGYTFIEPQAYLTCWLALNDTDETNGCPWIIPEIHRLGTLKHEVTDLGFEIPLNNREAVPIPLKAGSIAVFSSLTPHKTGPNTSSGIRKSYILQYAPDGAQRKISGSLREPVDDESRQYYVVKNGLILS